MSTREQLYTMLDTLPDEKLEGLLQFLSNFISVEDKHNETLSVLAELEEMKKHPDQYKSYDTFAQLLEDLDDEV